MHKKLLKKKPKPIILPICSQNINSVSFGAVVYISSNLYKKSPTALLSTFFRLNLPSCNYQKTDKKPVDEFL